MKNAKNKGLELLQILPNMQTLYRQADFLVFERNVDLSNYRPLLKFLTTFLGWNFICIIFTYLPIFLRNLKQFWSLVAYFFAFFVNNNDYFFFMNYKIIK